MKAAYLTGHGGTLQVLENPHAVSYEDAQASIPGPKAAPSYAPVDPHGPSEVLSGRGLY